MICRCGHGRHWHGRASGKKHLPCQFGRSRGASLRNEACKCRNYTPKEITPMATNAPTAPKAPRAAKSAKDPDAKVAAQQAAAATTDQILKPARAAAPAGSKWCSGAPTADPPRPKHIAPLEAFTTTSKSPDGRVGQCRACFSAYRKAAVAKQKAEAEALGIAPVKKERAPRAAKPEKIKAPRTRKAKAEPVAEVSDPAADRAAQAELRAQVRANGGSLPAEGAAPEPTPIRRIRKVPAASAAE